MILGETIVLKRRCLNLCPACCIDVKNQIDNVSYVFANFLNIDTMPVLI